MAGAVQPAASARRSASIRAMKRCICTSSAAGRLTNLHPMCQNGLPPGVESEYELEERMVKDSGLNPKLGTPVQQPAAPQQPVLQKNQKSKAR